MSVIGYKQKRRRPRYSSFNRRRKLPYRKLVLRTGLTRDKLKEALDRITKMDISLRKANMQCKVPNTARYPEHSPRMNNCHVVGRQWLERTRSNKTTLLSWRTSPRQLAELIAYVVTNVGDEPLALGQMLLPQLDRFRPRRTPDEECKYTVACKTHDGPTYLKADEPESDLNDPELHLQLGLRALSSYVAWDEGSRLYASGSLNRALLSNQSLRRTPELRVVTLDAYYRSRRATVEEQALADELKEWQELYKSSDYRAIVTARANTEANIAMTGCGLWYQSLGEHVVGTILTGRTNYSSDTTPTEIILSCRKSQSLFSRLLQPLNLRLKARRLARKIESNKSVDAIVDLASEWEFFYVAEKDYRTRLEPHEAEYIEEQVARNKLKFLMDPPSDKMAGEPLFPSSTESKLP